MHAGKSSPDRQLSHLPQCSQSQEDPEDESQRRTWAENAISAELADPARTKHKPGDIRSLSIEFADYPTGAMGEDGLEGLDENKMMCAPIIVRDARGR